MLNIRLNSPRLLLAMATLFTFAAALFGQATDSIIVGTVTDPAGMAVPNATVTATNKDTNVKYNTDANGTGEYRLNNVPVGRYDVSAMAQGFAMATVADVELQLNHTSSVNLTLSIGAVSTSVEVQEAAATIDTATAQLQTTYDSQKMIEVPLAGFTRVTNGTAASGFFNLSLLGAGVASQGGVGQGVGPSVAGQRPENNSFNLDGVSNNDYYQTGPLVYVSNDAVSQFNLVQNQFSAEYGGASGGVFNAIIKTGTNQIHGSAYEYFQNRDLNAVDATEVQQGLRSNPRFDSNRFGGTVGGPIKKDKLFYFGSFEYSPIGKAAQPGQTVYAPTAAGLSILNGMPGLNKTNLGVFEQYVPVAPVATNASPTTVNGVNIPTGPLSFASPAYLNQTAAVGAIDWNISDKDQVRGRYYYSKNTGPDTMAALPVFFEPQPDSNNLASISEFHNFSPTMENELRISFGRNNQVKGAGNFKFPGLSVFPNLAFDDLQLQVGIDPNTPSGSIQNAAQFQENITKTWGRHTFKAGYNFDDVIITNNFVQRARGDYDYVNLQQFLLDQQPSGGSLSGVAGERSVGLTGVPFGFLQNAAYFNDDWRVRPNLTLNLGLRYEYVTIPVGSRYQQYSAAADVPGVINFAAPKSNGNEWSPRLGFAYSPGKDNVWSIRGGVARSFDNTYMNLNGNATPAYFQTTIDVNPNNPVSNFLANGGLQGSTSGGMPTVAQARASVASYTFDQTRPYALTGTLGVQRLLARDYTIEARYVYTKGVHLWNQERLNILPQVTPSNYIPTFLTMPSAATLGSLMKTLGNVKSYIVPGGTAAIPYNDLAVYGFTNTITGYHPWGNSRYNGLALQMTKRYSKNFSYIAAYTWSHAFDDSTATNFSTILSPRRAQDYQNLRAEWASSALDRRHRLTLTPTYDFRPFDKSTNYMMKNIVGNWNISGTYTYQSPEYATVQSGLDSNLNGGDSLDRSIVNPAGAATVGSGVTGYNSAGVAQPAGSASIVAYVANNSNARYVVAGSGALANGGRNTFPLDPTNNIDAALMKRISLTETKRIEFGAQAFNLFNHSQFVGGYLSEVNYFQTNTISRNFLIPSSSTFGQYSGYFSSNSRQLQLVARFTF